MPDQTKILDRAARLVVLHELGDLPGKLTLQALADVLGVGHRSTALRDMADVEELRRMIPKVRAQILARLAVWAAEEAQKEEQ